jgi:hypothetical protein
VVEI